MTAPARGPVEDRADLEAVDRMVLDLEVLTFRYLGAKERAIRERFGWTPTRYFVRLNQLLEHPAALAYAPAVVNRLRARRTSSRGPGEREGR